VVSRNLMTRVLVLGLSNSAGTHKSNLAVIAKSINPRCFKGVKIFPVIYHATTKGQITTKLLLDWFEKYFVPEARAHCIAVGLDPKYKTVLLLDSCSAHANAELLVKNNLQGMSLSPNSMSVIHPCYQSILHSMKCKYSSIHVHQLLLACNDGEDVQEFLKVIILKVMIWVFAKGWASIIASTLKNKSHKL
jgi:hypothetical protein